MVAGLAGGIGLSVPVQADVRAGVEAWSRGDFAAAVAEWEGPAAAGDPDAMYNLAQAYRLGRGVTQDDARALQLYQRAAEAGHVQAADTYGLMLFQGGRREEALPLVTDAARRGDPRSQYLLGIAHFNGDLVERDWVRAYALLTLANASGLPQAAQAIAQMDEYIPLEQRRQAVDLVQEMREAAAAASASELAAADLGMASGSPRVPQPIATAEVPPSIASAEAAIAEAGQADGTQSPAEAGASFVENTPAEVRAPVAAAAPAATPVAEPDRASGPWRVQLGAFSVPGNAERLWDRMSSRSEFAGRERLLIPSGRVTLLQAGGYATRAEAQRVCTSLKNSGQDCLVTRD
ncbi:sporulation protein [Alteraurantiacibacter aquimixticola]|uniref:Sporulation protein n=2 Tax=Alteraurantiacibacter aquimixticola TaxID=2489173 RepID=A0A4T3F6M8_9SPHN|nr:sporulation protein [Alteraurantiacibacter aquimixticola]